MKKEWSHTDNEVFGERKDLRKQVKKKYEKHYPILLRLKLER